MTETTPSPHNPVEAALDPFVVNPDDIASGCEKKPPIVIVLMMVGPGS